MKYPINQSETPIPEKLLPFVTLGGKILLTKLPDYYQISCASGLTVLNYTEPELAALHPRLLDVIKSTTKRMKHAQTTFAVVRQNIRCWYGAIVIDSNGDSPRRFFVESFMDIMSDDDNPELANIRAKTFSTVVGELSGFASKIEREDTTVVAIKPSAFNVAWHDLESMWPGIRDVVTTCEQLGMQPDEVAQHVFGDNPAGVKPQTLNLPRDLSSV